MVNGALLDEPDEFDPPPADAGLVGGGLFCPEGCEGAFPLLLLLDCAGAFVGGDAAPPLLSWGELASGSDPGAPSGADSVTAAEESVHALISKPITKIATKIFFLFISISL